jgi:hypothetical protein
MPFEAPALNPTGGVTARLPVGLEYKKDPTRPGGGVFVAHGEAKKREEEFKDVPEGVIIRGSSDDETEKGKRGTNREALTSAPPISDERGRDDRERASMMASSAFAPPLPQDAGIMSSNQVKITETSGIGRGSGLMQSAIRNTLQTQSGDSPGTGKSPMVNFTPLPGPGVRRGSLANMNPAMNTRVAAGSNQVQVDGQPAGEEFVMVDNGYLDGIPGGMFDWGAPFSRRYTFK